MFSGIQDIDSFETIYTYTSLHGCNTNMLNDGSLIFIGHDYSRSPDDLQQPIAIPTLPNLQDKADPLWPFHFPPVEQGPQTHLLYQGKYLYSL